MPHVLSMWVEVDLLMYFIQHLGLKEEIAIGVQIGTGMNWPEPEFILEVFLCLGAKERFSYSRISI